MKGTWQGVRMLVSACAGESGIWQAFLLAFIGELTYPAI